MTEEHAAEAVPEESYEPPAVDDVETGDGPAVTSAGADLSFT